MVRDLSPLLSYLERDGFDGYLIDDDASDSDQRFVSGFSAPDSYQTLVTGTGVHLLVSSLEYGRAKSSADADSVTRTADYGVGELVERHGRFGAKIRVLAEFLDDHDVSSIAVPRSFPTGTADGLRDQGIAVTVEPDGIVTDIRSVKTEREIEEIRTTQAANEAAMAAAETLIAEATIDGGVLVHEDEPLTSERVRREIELTLLREGCSLDETIVAGGEQGADPHDRGSGPLEPHKPIVIDIFPRNKTSKYHADMTRTIVKGDPSAEVRRRYDVTRRAYEAALDAVEPDTTGKAVHDAACDVVEAAGYPTLRSDPETDVGFIHSTGHGVGLDVHEGPSISPSGEELEVGHVITIEPGIYDPDHGGIRIEDIVVVTEDGYENLTSYPVSIEATPREF